MPKSQIFHWRGIARLDNDGQKEDYKYHSQMPCAGTMSQKFEKYDWIRMNPDFERSTAVQMWDLRGPLPPFISSLHLPSHRKKHSGWAIENKKHSLTKYIAFGLLTLSRYTQVTPMEQRIAICHMLDNVHTIELN